jgi:transposase
MLDDTRKLPDDPSRLKEMVTLLAAELKNRDLKIMDLQQQLAGHNRNRFGTKSESMDQLQLALENEEIAASAETRADAPPPDAEAPPKEKPKRKPLPAHLKRNETVLTPDENCAECGGDLRTLGEDVTEELEYVPGRFVVNRIVRPRMACKCCEAICQRVSDLLCIGELVHASVKRKQA